MRTKRWLWWSVLAIIVFVGGLFRMYELNTAPYWMDEGYTVIATLSIEHTGHSILPSGETYWCPLYCYPAAALTKHFNNSAASYRAFAGIAGILFIIAIAIVSKKMFGGLVSLLVAGVTAFSYWQIAWSRQARWYTLFALFFWIAIYCFYRLLYDEKLSRRARILYLFGTIIATVLAILTHALGYLLPFLLCIWYIFSYVQKKKPARLLHVALALCITALVIFVLEKVFALHFFASLSHLVTFHNNFFSYTRFIWREYWLFLVFALIALARPFFPQRFFETKSKTPAQTSVLNTNTRFFLLYIALAYFIPLAFFTELIEYRYVFHVMPAIMILGIVGMVDVARLFSHRATRAAHRFFITAGIAACFIAVFFISGEGVLKPHSFYLLEADNPETTPGLPYYAYTPQPDWNAAYAFVKTHPLGNNDTIISTMPQFTKIFLDTPGYWIAYDYLGQGNTASLITNGREHYVGAMALTTLDELKNLTTHTHGYIIFDYMAIDDRLPDDVVTYMISSFPEVFHSRTNAYSEVWVYQF